MPPWPGRPGPDPPGACVLRDCPEGAGGRSLGPAPLVLFPRWCGEVAASPQPPCGTVGPWREPEPGWAGPPSAAAATIWRCRSLPRRLSAPGGISVWSHNRFHWQKENRKIF